MYSRQRSTCFQIRWRFIYYFLALGFLGAVYANEPQEDFKQEIEKIRFWHAPDKTRIVFDLNNGFKHKVFRLSQPDRLVVDIENGNLSSKLPVMPKNDRILNFRSGVPSTNQLRFVFELARPLKVSDFVLTPNELYGHRLVLDLSEPPQAGVQTVPQKSAQVIQAQSSISPAKDRKFIIAVDAGHGGEDPGALGHKGSREKRITLKIAQKLVASLNRDPEITAFLVRDGDYYIKLHKRRELAREQNADMFISIHADAFSKPSANGFSVFALSQSGATSAMARALAEKENASDLIGGVSLSDKDEVLAKVLVDLSMTNTISESVEFGSRVLKQLAKLGKLHSRKVEQAGFAVLKSPDIPSVLIETGFITNPREEQKLRSSSYQQQIADAIYRAVKGYMDESSYRETAHYVAHSNQSAPATVYQSLVKPKKPSYHTVKRGDSLSEIAERYKISVRTLKQINGLRGNTIVVGQKLKLPSSYTTASNSPSTQSGRTSNSKPKATKPAPSPEFHIVKRGESLSLISARYNVKISALKSMNGLRSNTLSVGQRLKLPAGIQKATQVKYHIVKRGDTLSEIAEQYGVSMRRIREKNALRSSVLQVGQRLKIH